MFLSIFSKLREKLSSVQQSPNLCSILTTVTNVPVKQKAIARGRDTHLQKNQSRSKKNKLPTQTTSVWVFLGFLGIVSMCFCQVGRLQRSNCCNLPWKISRVNLQAVHAGPAQNRKEILSISIQNKDFEKEHWAFCPLRWPSSQSRWAVVLAWWPLVPWTKRRSGDTAKRFAWALLWRIQSKEYCFMIAFGGVEMNNIFVPWKKKSSYFWNVPVQAVYDWSSVFQWQPLRLKLTNRGPDKLSWCIGPSLSSNWKKSCEVQMADIEWETRDQKCNGSRCSRIFSASSKSLEDKTEVKQSPRGPLRSSGPAEVSCWKRHLTALHPFGNANIHPDLFGFIKTIQSFKAVHKISWVLSISLVLKMSHQRHHLEAQQKP